MADYWQDPDPLGFPRLGFYGTSGRIRLFQLLGAKGEDDPLEGVLSVHKLKHLEDDQPDGSWSHVKPPPFEALSYTWGLHKKTAMVRLRETSTSEAFTRFPVTVNLEQALKKLRKDLGPEESRLLWIDAICISQDDKAEKAFQIKRIADIFGQASKVLVWLGNEDRFTDIAFDFVERLLQLEFLDDLVQSPVSPSEWAAFLELLRRPWFGRRWIVQEISVAEEAVILCGDRTMPWLTLANAVSLLASKHRDLRGLFQKSEAFENNPSFLGEVEALGATSLVEITNAVLRKGRDKTTMEPLLSLEVLLTRLALFQVSEPRDAVFSLLWLACDTNPRNDTALISRAVWRTPSPLARRSPPSELEISENEFSIDVDYNNTVFEVFQQFIQVTLERTKSLDILCRAWAQKPLKESDEAALPSWMPTVDEASFKLDYTNTFHRVKADPLVGPASVSLKSYNACGKSRAFWDQENLFLDRRLRTCGFIIDIVDVLKDRAYGGLIPESWLELAEWDDCETNPPDTFWRTLVADKGTDGFNPPPSYFQLACKYAFKRRPVGNGLHTVYFPRTGKCPSVVSEYLQRAEKVVWDNRLARTRGATDPTIRKRKREGTSQPVERPKLLALVPGKTEPGDLICILYGCSVPVILRKLNHPPQEDQVPPEKDGEEDDQEGNIAAEGFPTARVRQHKSLRISTVFQQNREPKTSGKGISRSSEKRALKYHAREIEPSNVPQNSEFFVRSPAIVDLDAPKRNYWPDGKSCECCRRGRCDIQDTFPFDCRRCRYKSEPCFVGDWIVDNDEYVLVGQCYVHGMMNGEAFQYQRQHRIKEQDFRIV